MSTPVIDFHAHVLEPEAVKQCATHSVATGFGARPMAPGTPGFNLLAGMLDPEIHGPEGYWEERDFHRYRDPEYLVG